MQSYVWQGSIAKVDGSLQNKVWEKKLNDTLSNIISMENIKPFYNDFIVVGQDLSYSEVKPSEVSISGMLARFDEQGKIKWQRNYRGLDSTDGYYYNYLYDIDIDENMNIISCGRSNHFNGPNHGWILKLDSTGCLTENYCGVPSLSNNETEKKESEIQIFPNPFHSTIQLDSNEPITQIKLYNQLGQLVFKQINSEKEISLNHLPEGLYFLHIKTKQGEVVKKVVKY